MQSSWLMQLSSGSLRPSGCGLTQYFRIATIADLTTQRSLWTARLFSLPHLFIHLKELVPNLLISLRFLQYLTVTQQFLRSFLVESLRIGWLDKLEFLNQLTVLDIHFQLFFPELEWIYKAFVIQVDVSLILGKG